VVVLALLAVLGCTGDSARRPPNANQPPGALLAGTWDITLKLEHALAFSMEGRSLPRRASGAVTLLESHDQHISIEGMHVPTYVGAYDIMFDSLRFPPLDAGVLPGVAARTVSISAPSSSGNARDSVYLVLDPGTARRTLELRGVVVGDSASGVWTSELLLGGSGGTFTLRRHGR
jgi:hypothetical protein